MNFDLVIQLQDVLNNAYIFKVTLIGVKSLALAFLAIKMFEMLVQNVDATSYPVGSFFSMIGTALIILSSDWVIDFFEQFMVTIDTSLNSLGADKDIFSKILDEGTQNFLEVKKERGFWGKMSDLVFGDIIDSIGTVVIGGITTIIAGFFKIADMVVTLGYLLIRMFIVQLLKFIFPIALLFSVFDNTKSFFYSWIKRYVGCMVLGVAYIGIFWFIQRLIEIMMLVPVDDFFLFTGTVETQKAFLAVCVCYPIKFKLLASVTSYINSMFS